MNKYYFEMTDTFGDELNYCWIRRFTIEAKSLHSALIKLSKETGFNFKNNGNYYKVKNAGIAAYELDYEIDSEWIEKSTKI